MPVCLGNKNEPQPELHASPKHELKVDQTEMKNVNSIKCFTGNKGYNLQELGLGS